MSRYSDEDRERVRDAIDMLALIGSRTELRRAGANSYFGCCPFHDERTASFHVRPEQKHYHCFGCQVSGDPFKFVMETEGLSFPEALESLAERFAVTIEPIEENPQAAARRRQRERLLELLERTTSFYERVLWDSGEAEAARALLSKRGLSRETCLAYRVGYSPSAWDRVLMASREAGFTEEELLAAGLAQKARDRDALFDRFRGRIMFPLADPRGRVLGFGARSMRDEQGPKYLNSAEGPVYSKGEQLFGFDVARTEAARSGSLVLVEGYVDVLALFEAGVSNAVAIMGTSLTDEQAAQLERSASTLSLALDADRAGQEAMIRAGRIAKGRSLELRVVPMPSGKDPGDLLVEEGPERLRSRTTVSEPFASFRVRVVLDRADLSTAEGKDRALIELQPVFADLSASVLREELVHRVAATLEIGDDLVESVLGASNAGGPNVPPAKSTGARSGAADLTQRPLDRQARVEREFLSLCLAMPDVGGPALAEAVSDGLFSGEEESRAANHVLAHLEDPLSGADTGPGGLAELIAKLLARSSVLQASKPAIQLELLQLRRLHLDRGITRAKRENPSLAADLAREREVIRGRIDRAMEALEEHEEAGLQQQG